jgi:hypothetical protein
MDKSDRNYSELSSSPVCRDKHVETVSRPDENLSSMPSRSLSQINGPQMASVNTILHESASGYAQDEPNRACNKGGFFWIGMQACGADTYLKNQRMRSLHGYFVKDKKRYPSITAYSIISLL